MLGDTAAPDPDRVRDVDLERATIGEGEVRHLPFRHFRCAFDWRDRNPRDRFIVAEVRLRMWRGDRASPLLRGVFLWLQVPDNVALEIALASFRVHHFTVPFILCSVCCIRLTVQLKQP